MKTKPQILLAILVVALLAVTGAAIYEWMQVSNINGKIKEIESNDILIRKQLAQASATITNLQQQLLEANSRISGLQRIPNLNVQQTITKDQIIIQSANEKTLIADFNASHAGYLFVTGYASTTTGYIMVNNTQYPVSFGIALQIPVVPGHILVYYGNTNYQNSLTGSMTVEFWY